MRPTIKGHDTANYKGAQLRWLPTSELVRLGRFRVFLAMTLWTCIVLLVGWTWARWVADRVRLRRGQVVIGHRAPATRGVTEVQWWYRWRDNLGCDGSGWHGKWC